MTGGGDSTDQELGRGFEALSLGSLRAGMMLVWSLLPEVELDERTLEVSSSSGCAQASHGPLCLPSPHPEGLQVEILQVRSSPGSLPVHTGGRQMQEGLGDSCLANIILSTHTEPRGSCSMCCSCPAVVICQQIPGEHIFLLGVE